MKRSDLEQAQSALDATAKKRMRLSMIVMVTVLTILSFVYLVYVWNRYQKTTETEAVVLAESVATLLHAEHIASLTGNSEDIDSPNYQITKRSLMQLVHSSDRIRFAYLLAQKGDELIFLVDSEPVTSPDYSPPGQVYYEATSEDMRPFTEGVSVLTGPTKDRWGTWYSALIPIKVSSETETIAALGIDYSAQEWTQRIFKRLIPDIVIVISLYVVAIALFLTWKAQQVIEVKAKKLAIDEALFHSVFDQAPVGIAIIKDKGFTYRFDQGNLTMNSMFEKILGRTGEELAEIEWPDITYPDDLQADMEQFNRFVRGEIDGYSMEKRYIRPDGSLVWANMIIASVIGNLGPYTMHLCLLEDISARKEMESELKESERSKAVLLSHLPGLAYRCKNDESLTMLYVSAGCHKLTGYQPEALLNNRDLSYKDIIAPEYCEILCEEWKKVLPTRDFLKYEYEIITAQGERRWVMELGQGIFGESGELEALEGIILDVSDRKKAESILKYNSEYDVLTGLHNRSFLENLLREEQITKRGVKRALVGINLSTMHILGLTYGFQYSQALIKRVADTLSAMSNENRRLFYTYENRFVFYLSNYADKTELTAFCEEIIRVLQTVLKAERIGGGIGIIEIDGSSEASPDRVLKNLLVASEKALASMEGDFSYSFYDEAMEALIVREELIRLELIRVLERKSGARFYLQFQPIYELRTDRVVGFEALARLTSDQLGEISPTEFIPIAEKTKLILPLGKEIIRQSFQFIERMCQIGNSTASVSINISAIQILQTGFLEDMLLMIDEFRIDPRRICLELTESVFSSRYQDINTLLGLIKEHGIRIAIDDFGTGYSSFARERELNVDCLKIDKFFIDKLLQVREEQAVTGDIISMAHKLGHCAIAEGVEHEEQMRYLRKYGCDMVQGYYISMPLDEANALELLNAPR